MESRAIKVLILALIFAVGIFLRLPGTAFAGKTNPLHLLEFMHPAPKIQELRFDEGMYRNYLTTIIDGGLGCYPQLVEHYIELQGKLDHSILPPVRFLYVFVGYLWHQLFQSDPLSSLNDVSSLFSVLTLALSTLIVWRIRGAWWAIAVASLIAVAPMQVHMSQHALIDGFFTFWALLCLWLLWENLQTPRDWRWLGAYIVALSLLVLTKENSFFVWFALVTLIATNRWFRYGTVSNELLAATVLGPILGVAILICLAGGVDLLFQTYRLSVTKNFQLPYAVLTGDGPWYRYLLDVFTVSPIILILSFGTLFRINRAMKPELFMLIFISASYLVMCNVKYGMNLRYANMWDLPLRFLALSQIVAMASLANRYCIVIAASAIVCLTVIECRQYWILAVQYPLYEPIPFELLRALHILKGVFKVNPELPPMPDQ